MWIVGVLMDDMLRVLVIIPAYNEQANIVQTVSSVVEAGYDYIVVNDGSTDKTLSICRQHGFNVLAVSYTHLTLPTT